MTIQSKTRGTRMNITGATAPTVTLTPQGPAAAAAPAEAPSQAQAPATTALQSDVLQPAKEALARQPEFDAARVAELRDALAKGELPFDPARLAGLIQRFHGSGR
jgi:negative regulator of flagellin synthesis FlgM